MAFERATARALGLVDILEVIAENTDDWNSLHYRNAALVATLWTEPFLSRLWNSDADIQDLFRVVSNAYQGIRVFPAAIDTQKLSRWETYSPWLLGLVIPYLAPNPLANILNTLEAICAYKNPRHPRDLLPSIESLYMDQLVDGDRENLNDFHRFLRFVPKGLKHVTIVFSDSNDCFIPELFTQASKDFLSLESITIIYDESEEVYQVDDIAWFLSEALPSFRRLQGITLPPTFATADVLLKLGMSLRLSHFTLCCFETDAEYQAPQLAFIDALKRVSRKRKRKLFEQITCLEGIYLPSHFAKQYLGMFSTTKLVLLKLMVPVCLAGAEGCNSEAHESLYDAISSFPELKLLTIIYFFPEGPVDWSTVAKLQSLPSYSLARLKKLQELCIHHPCGFEFGGRHIVEASKYWPHLKELQLLDLHSEHYPQTLDIWTTPTQAFSSKAACSAQILGALLQNMPHLHTLSINFTSPGPIWDRSTIRTDLKLLRLGSTAKFGDPANVSSIKGYLSRVLPNSVSIIVDI